MRSSWQKLIISMITKFGLGFLIIGIVLFISAGSLSYVNGWVFILALAIPMAIFGIFLLIRDPAALARRLISKEPDKKQRKIIVLSGLMFILVFVISGMDYRFGWSPMPFFISLTALIIMLLGYGVFVAVMTQNPYASRVVDVYDDQKITTHGLYSLVRHPMYSATLLIYLSIPFILGSWFAVIPMLIYPIVLVRRIKYEEALLIKELSGYSEYKNKVKYRLMPFIW